MAADPWDGLADLAKLAASRWTLARSSSSASTKAWRHAGRTGKTWPLPAAYWLWRWCNDDRPEVPQHWRVSAICLSHAYGTAELLEGIVDRTHELAIDSEREDVASEVRDLIARFGLQSRISRRE